MPMRGGGVPALFPAAPFTLWYPWARCRALLPPPRTAVSQEAVAMGLQAALAKEDDIIGTYRCHGLQYVRGCDVSRCVHDGVARSRAGARERPPA